MTDTACVTEFRYVGSELDIFSEATNWKAYWSRRLARYIAGDVLEAGAGIGSNTALLRGLTQGRWLCLEPDAALVAQLHENLAATNLGGACETLCGTLATLGADRRFDTILYIDVLEHIEGDADELVEACRRLRPGGRVIVLSPAHPWLFSPFDASIGHFRRYDKEMLRSVSPPGLELESLFYLDACGIAASAANQLMLRQSMPTRAQIGLWDKRIIPVSRLIDPLLGYSVGKSIIGVWRKPQQAAQA